MTITRATWGDAGDARLFAWVDDVGAASACGDPADLSVDVVAANPDPAATGDSVTADLAFGNAGPATAYGTSVTIELGAGLSASGVSSTTADCALVSASSARCSVGELASFAHVIDSNSTNDTDSLLVGTSALTASSTPR